MNAIDAINWAALGADLGRIGLAMLLGGLIGAEREYADKPAGFRTHTLTAGAAALVVSLSYSLVNQIGAGTLEQIRADPFRVLEAIITGVSFIGAGTIIRRPKENAVDGLTTAASLLFAAVIGMGVALQEIPLAVASTLLVLLILWGLRLIQRLLRRSASYVRHRASYARGVDAGESPSLR